MKKMIIFSVIVLVLIVGGCSGSSQSTTPEENKSDYPNKPIEMIVPTPAGGAYDTVARALERALPKYLPNDATVVVVNKSGGKNTMGVSELFQAKPDGYTIGFVPSSTLSTSPHYGDTPYNYDSFQTLAKTAVVPGIMYVAADAPYQNFDEWFEYVKKNPGKFNVSTVAGAKVLLEMINEKADIKMNVVPFDGFAPAMTALLGGHVEGTVVTLGDALAATESGKVRPIYTSSSERVPGVDAPTLIENGIDVLENKIIGAIAPKGLPTDVLKILEEAFKKAIEDPEVVTQIEKLGLVPNYGNAEEFQNDINENYELDGEMLKAAGLIK